jgi:hypothetical protein
MEQASRSVMTEIEPAPDEVKKPYQSPVLEEYGDIRELTQTTPVTEGSDALSFDFSA